MKLANTTTLYTHSPHPLAAFDLLRRATVDVRERCHQERHLNDLLNHQGSFLTGRKVAPPLVGPHDHLHYLSTRLVVVWAARADRAYRSSKNGTASKARTPSRSGRS